MGLDHLHGPAEELHTIGLDFIRLKEGAWLDIFIEEVLHHTVVIPQLLIVLKPPLDDGRKAVFGVPDGRGVPDLLEEAEAIAWRIGAALHSDLAFGEEATQKLFLLLLGGSLRKVPRQDLDPLLRILLEESLDVRLNVSVAVAGCDDRLRHVGGCHRHDEVEDQRGCARCAMQTVANANMSAVVCANRGGSGWMGFLKCSVLMLEVAFEVAAEGRSCSKARLRSEAKKEGAPQLHSHVNSHVHDSPWGNSRLQQMENGERRRTLEGVCHCEVQRRHTNASVCICIKGRIGI